MLATFPVLSPCSERPPQLPSWEVTRHQRSALFDRFTAPCGMKPIRDLSFKSPPFHLPSDSS